MPVRADSRIAPAVGRGWTEARRLLLSDNDLAAIQTALDGGRIIEITRTMGALRITVTTARATGVWSPYRMLARVEIWSGHIYSTQWCVSSEEVMAACRRGCR